MDKNGSADSEE